ncbi:unnamed protein product [Closterium sp. NIES-64]|nr:unnamed protein product [Closterium sp. NIES-64]
MSHSHVVRNGLSLLGVIPRQYDTYSVPISTLPRPASPVRSVGIVYLFEPPSTPAGWEPHPSIVLVPSGGEGSSSPPAGSPSTVNSTPGKRPPSSRRPRPASPPRFPFVPQFPPRSSLRPQEREEESRPEKVELESQSQQERVEQESRAQQQMQLPTQQERVEEESRLQQERATQESLSQQRVQLQPQQERAREEPQAQQQGQVPSQQTPEEAEQRRLRLCNLSNPAPARLVRGPLPSPPVPPVQSLSSS